MYKFLFSLMATAALVSCGSRTSCQNAKEAADDVDTVTLEQTSMPGMCAKEEMQEDGFISLAKIEVWPQYLDEYLKFAAEVGEVSLRTEPGVLTMYSLQEKDNPCMITIIETYASQAAYESHIASEHFQKYKQGTLQMVKSLELARQTPLNPANRITNYILP